MFFTFLPHVHPFRPISLAINMITCPEVLLEWLKSFSRSPFLFLSMLPISEKFTSSHNLFTPDLSVPHLVKLLCFKLPSNHSFPVVVPSIFTMQPWGTFLNANVSPFFQRPSLALQRFSELEVMLLSLYYYLRPSLPLASILHMPMNSASTLAEFRHL